MNTVLLLSRVQHGKTLYTLRSSEHNLPGASKLIGIKTGKSEQWMQYALGLPHKVRPLLEAADAWLNNQIDHLPTEWV